MAGPGFRRETGTTVFLASFLIVALREGVLAELNRDRSPSGLDASRLRKAVRGPDFCLSAGVTDVVKSKGVVKLNIDPIVRS